MRADKIRLLQFVEALTASAAAYGDLHPRVRNTVETAFPGLGQLLTSLSDGLAQGVYELLEERGAAR